MNRAQTGVCGTCRHAKRLTTRGGGDILLCRLSETDSKFPRYPALPVLSCPGWSAPEAVS
ncbi:hypothetical protein EPO15_01580 [bacterium]|nr:MAG: hypothetical protein EPO15_01580 [bacterium]